MSNGGHLQSLVVNTGITTIPVFISKEQAGSYLHNLIDAMVDIHLTIVAAHLIVLHQTTVVHSTQGNIEIGLFTTTSYIYFIVLRGTVFQEQIAPISIGTIIINIECRCTIIQFIGQYTFRSDATEHGIISLRCLITFIPSCISTLVYQALYFLSTVHRMCCIGSTVERVVEIESY